MSRENKIAFLIVIFGAVAALFYYYSMEHSEKLESLPKRAFVEQIVLPLHPPQEYAQIDIVQEYLEELKELFENNLSTLPLDSNELDSYAAIAQEVVLADENFLSDARVGKKLLHSDMMSVRPALIGSLTSEEVLLCEDVECYEAIKYNFATNTTTKAIVDIDNRRVLGVVRYPSTQPDISLRLTRIAQAIAMNAPEVKEQLGKNVLKKDISMANVRASLNDSICEDSAHLCVAPTIADHQNERALWAIIDLTELRLVAAKWASLGKSTTPACISERMLQNRHIMENYCKQDTHLQRGEWELHYRLTGSDGLEVRDVSFRGKKVIKSAKIVDWHVSYYQESNSSIDPKTQAYIDGRRVEFVPTDNGYMFGYNDAMGCPMFSTSVVLAFNAPQVRDLLDESGERVGFYLVQDFRNPKWPLACNYRYENRYLFYDDGRFAILGTNIGRGCGDNALYRPILRVDMSSDDELFYTSKEQVKIEHRFDENSTDLQYKIVDNSTGDSYIIKPLRSPPTQNIKAMTYVSEYRQNQGDTDLLSVGSCCNLQDDGVGQFLDDKESLKNIVIWHVPHMTSSSRDGEQRCWADTHIGENGNLEVQEWACSVGLEFTPKERD